MSTTSDLSRFLHPDYDTDTAEFDRFRREVAQSLYPRPASGVALYVLEGNARYVAKQAPASSLVPEVCWDRQSEAVVNDMVYRGLWFATAYESTSSSNSPRYRSQARHPLELQHYSVACRRCITTNTTRSPPQLRNVVLPVRLLRCSTCWANSCLACGVALGADAEPMVTTWPQIGRRVCPTCASMGSLPKACFKAKSASGLAFIGEIPRDHFSIGVAGH